MNFINCKLTHDLQHSYVRINPLNFTKSHLLSLFLTNFSSFSSENHDIEFLDPDNDWILWVEESLHSSILQQLISQPTIRLKSHFRKAHLKGLSTSVRNLATTAVSYIEAIDDLHKKQTQLDGIKNVLFVLKPKDPDVIVKAKEMSLFLIQNYGIRVYLSDTLNKTKELDFASFREDCPAIETHLKFYGTGFCSLKFDCIDLVVCLGGDGTLLYAAWLFQHNVPPILAFHMGSLGFLAHFKANDYSDTFDKVFGENGVHVNLRMRMSVRVYKEATSHVAYGDGESDMLCSAADDHFQVLNEVAIDRGSNAGMIELDLFANGKLFTSILADGLVVATSTGSTAYSLSAGGSLVHPEQQSILITPVCAHSLTCRPMIIPGNVELRIVVPVNSRVEPMVSFDGRRRIELHRGDTICIRSSRYPVPTLCQNDPTADWLCGLAHCLNWNERIKQKELLK